MSNRRNFLSLVGGAAAVWQTPFAAAQVMCDLSQPVSTSGRRSAPGLRVDALERGSSAPHQIADAIHRNFQETIERNFAALNAVGAIELVGKLNDQELGELANLYAASALNSGKSANLLQTLIPKIGPGGAARLARHFPADQVYAEVVKVSPTAGNRLLAELDRYEPWVPRARVLVNENPLDYTLREIYLNYRTAPKGSFSVTAAMYETATFAGSRLVTSFTSGYALGTVIQKTWEYYSPDSWSRFSDFLGSRVDRFVDATFSIVGSIPWSSISQEMSRGAGYWQGVLWDDFQKPGNGGWFYNSGGDFGVTEAWYDFKHAHPACQW